MRRKITVFGIITMLILCSVYYVRAGTLEFDGVPVDITTTAGEDLVITPGTGGNTQIGDASGANTNATSNDDLNITGVLEVDGAAYIDGAATVSGALTASSGATSGSDIVSDTDSTDDLGSLTVAWANLFVDAIKTVSGVNLTILPTVAYTIIGDAGTAGNVSANDDLFVSGALEVDGVTYADGGITATTVTTSSQAALTVNPYGIEIGNTGEIRLRELSANNTEYIGFKAPDSIDTSVIWTLPNADGSANQTLVTDASGTLSWSSTIGSADVTGPSSSTDNAITRFNGTTGKVLQNSGVTIEDSDNLTTSGTGYFGTAYLAILGGDAGSYGGYFVDNNSHSVYLADDTNAITAVGNITTTGTGSFGTAGATTNVPMTILGTGADSSGLRIGLNDTGAGGINVGGLSIPHPTAAEEDTTAFCIRTFGTAANMGWGGGNGGQNAVKQHTFYAAANNTTTTGTGIFKIDVDGVYVLGDDIKLAFGASEEVDSYIQFGGTNLEYYSSGAHDFLAGNITTTGTGTFGAGTGDDAVTIAEGSHLRIGSPEESYRTTSEIIFGDSEDARIYEEDDDSLILYGGAKASLKSDTGILELDYTGLLTLTGNFTTTGTGTFSKVNAAGGGADALTLSGTLGNFDGSDTFRGLYLNYTNGTHSGASNNFYGVDITGITGSGSATENALNIGSGWDSVLVVDGTEVIDGSGNVASGSVAAAGADTQVQYNSSDSLAGDAGLTYNAGTDALTVSGKGTFGSTYQVIIGDDGNTKAGYFTDTFSVVNLVDANYALHALNSGRTGAGHFVDFGTGTEVTIASAAPYAIEATGADIALLEDDRKMVWGAEGTTDSYIQFGGTNLEYYSSGAHDFGAGNLTTTGTVTAGSTHQAIIGDDANTKAGSFTAGANKTVTILGDYGIDIDVSGYDSSCGIYTTDGDNSAALLYVGTAGLFTDPLHNLALCNGTNAIDVNYSALTIDASGNLATTGTGTFQKVNAAGGSADALIASGTLGNFDGSDTFRGLYLNYTNGTHAGASNNFYGVDVAGITGSGSATENAINIGSGWDSVLVVNGTEVIDGSGNVASGQVAAAGANTQVQYNASDSLAGDAGLTYNAGTDALTVSGTGRFGSTFTAELGDGTAGYGARFYDGVSVQVLIAELGSGIASTGEIVLVGNDLKLGLGARGTDDSYIQFGGTNLEFFSAGGHEFTGNILMNGYDIAMQDNAITGTTNIASTSGAEIDLDTGELRASDNSVQLDFLTAGTLDAKDNNLTTTGNITIDSDSSKLILGDGQQASIYYDGLNLQINPQDVGSGNIMVPAGELHVDHIEAWGAIPMEIGNAGYGCTLVGPTTSSLVNSAGFGADALTLSGTLGNFDGTDTFRGLYLNYTNGTHSGLTNNFYGVDVAAITGSGNATENAINVGSGWDSVLVVNGTEVIDGSGTIAVGQVGAAGNDTEVQYNSSGSIAGDAGLTYNAGTDALTVSGILTSDKVYADEIRDETGTISMSYFLGGLWYAGDSYNGNGYSTTGWGTVSGNALTVGDGTAVDRTITFDCSANDATITFDEDADEFEFGDADLTTTGTGRFDGDIVDSSGKKVLETEFRYLNDTTGERAISVGARQLFDTNASDIILDWATAGLADFKDSAITTTGTLGAGATTVTSLDAGSGLIQTTGTVQARYLDDSSGDGIIDLDYGDIWDSGANELSIDFDDRYLYASNGSDVILDWSTAGTAAFGDSNITTTGTGTFAILNTDQRLSFLKYGVAGTPDFDTFIGTASGDDNFTFYVADYSARLSNIKDGTQNSDAATVGQMNTAVAVVADDLSGNYVPYSGATANVDIGAYNFSAGTISSATIGHNDYAGYFTDGSLNAYFAYLNYAGIFDDSGANNLTTTIVDVGNLFALQSYDGTNTIRLADSTYAVNIGLDNLTIDNSGNLATTGTLQVNNTTIGAGAAGVDYTLTFNGASGDCVITYDEGVNILNMGNTHLTTTGDLEAAVLALGAVDTRNRLQDTVGGGIELNSVEQITIAAGLSSTVLNIAFNLFDFNDNDLTTTGNVGIGTGTFAINTVSVLALGNGTAPAAGTANQSYMYAKDESASSEMFVMDEAGNETKISPHDPITGEWVFYSKNVNTGRTVLVNMEKLVKAVEELTGEKFMIETHETVQ